MTPTQIHADWLANGNYPLDKKVQARSFVNVVSGLIRDVSTEALKTYYFSPEEFTKVSLYVLVRAVSSSGLSISSQELCRRVLEAYDHGLILKEEKQTVSNSVSDLLSMIEKTLQQRDNDDNQRKTKNN